MRKKTNDLEVIIVCFGGLAVSGGSREGSWGVLGILRGLRRVLEESWWGLVESWATLGDPEGSWLVFLGSWVSLGSFLGGSWEDLGVS